MAGGTAIEMFRHNASLIGKVADGPLLDATLRLLAKWRSDALAQNMIKRDGPAVQTGPFAGMAYRDFAAEGSLAARLLGCYESELHPHIEAFAAEGLDHVVDIGCAEGYYAVGLARLMPEASIHAFDTDAAARRGCEALAAANGVSERVHIGGEFFGGDFANFVGSRTLVFMDIEGAEDALLDPLQFPALRCLNIIVETHPKARPGITEALIGRFAPSHTIIQVDHAPTMPPHPAWLQGLSHLDLVLALWEWREGPTPWLVMRPKASRLKGQ